MALAVKAWTFSGITLREVWGGNGGAVAAQEYVMERKFVERYRKKISGSSQKIKLLIRIVFQCE